MPKAVTSNELREMYQRFFESKGHTRIPSSPLIPEHDPSVLFTTAGMHPLVPYLKGQPHPAGKRLTDVQKCLRTTDIEDVGDATHATVFEMLGNWSLGDYFKKEAISMSWELLTSPEWLGLDPKYLAVSVFAGDNDAPTDEEAVQQWQQMGVPDERIARLSKEDNWWPAGGGAPGPQGPDTEMFYWVGKEEPPVKFEPTDKRWVEIWNDVFMQFNRTDDGKYEPLPQQNVDTGMGLERTIMVLNGLSSIYDIDSYQTLMKLVREQVAEPDDRHERIVADHIKAATFVLGDEHPVVPSKTEQGYVLRRIIRRGIRSARVLGITDIATLMTKGAQLVIDQYKEFYPSLAKHQEAIIRELQQEIERFETVLVKGLQQFAQIRSTIPDHGTIPGEEVFKLYETYGFPIELTEELAREHKLAIDMGGFEAAAEQHRQTSREASKGRFAGGLADHSDQSVKYHTATHLLHQALRIVLGNHVEQRGSNINPERLRFDFSHPAKLTDEELQKVQDIVNEKIQADISVIRGEMTVPEAKAKGALGLFEHKYGDKVSVYTIGDFSCEICGGPHVEHTGQLGKFSIKKQESVSAGIRRIKATLE